jgi:hypothetical protein
VVKHVLEGLDSIDKQIINHYKLQVENEKPEKNLKL